MRIENHNYESPRKQHFQIYTYVEDPSHILVRDNKSLKEYFVKEGANGWYDLKYFTCSEQSYELSLNSMRRFLSIECSGCNISNVNYSYISFSDGFEGKVLLAHGKTMVIRKKKNFYRFTQKDFK